MEKAKRENIDRKFKILAVNPVNGKIYDESNSLLLCAKDKAVPAALRAYAEECERIGANPEHVESVTLLLGRVLRYQAAIESRVPDTVQEDMNVSIFTAGNTVRHKQPYWGEMAYYIHEVTTDGIVGNPTGSKHGKAWERGKTGCLISWHSEDKYKICPLYMRVWLWFLGRLAEFRKY